MFRIALRTLVEQENSDLQIERAIRRRLRDTSDPLQLPNTAFVQYFRVNKCVYQYLLGVLRSSLPEGGKSFAVPTHIKLTSCLRFFAEGAYQKAVGRDREVGMAQSTFGKVLAEVLNVFERQLCPRWIKWPNPEEQSLIAQQFYEKFKIPGVIGCVDGTHVAIIPPATNKHLFYNRKGFHSLNVMIVCDNNLKIRCIVAKHPGSAHDSRVWTTSQCREVLRRGYVTEASNFWLLGDAGYPLEPWLMTPFRNPQQGSIEETFNEAHSRCRNVVERTIGVIKNQWRCLFVARQLHYSPKKSVQILNVCSALHNICIHYKSNFDLAVEEELAYNNAFSDVEESITNIAFSDDAQRINQI